MSSNFATILSDLTEFLEEELPEEWLIIDAESLGNTASRRITLTYQQTHFVSEVGGRGLAAGQAGVEFELVLSAPETDGVKATKRLSAAALVLCFVIDRHPSLAWTTGTKVRLESGETAYRFPITILANYLAPPESEED